MFREIRRKDRKIPNEIGEKILKESEVGYFSVISSDNGYPYVIPVNHVYVDGKIYFHSALEGHKIESIKKSDKVSFCAVSEYEIRPSKFATGYKSAVIFGRAYIVSDEIEKRKALDAIIDKFSAEFRKEGAEYIDKASSAVVVVGINIENMSAKSAE